MSIALATLCIGEDYQARWDKYCSGNWRRYCDRHGYDLVIFREPLDTSPRARARSPAWQKCLVLSELARYERVIWVDSDVVIHPAAPAIHADAPSDRIGAVISGSYIAPELRAPYLKRARARTGPPGTEAELWAADQISFYARARVDPPSPPDIVQTGVMVLGRAHETLLTEIYQRDYPVDIFGHDQFPLSAEILSRRLLHRLDWRFNLVFPEYMVVHYPFLLLSPAPEVSILMTLAISTAWDNSFFLHFAGRADLIPYIPSSFGSS
jgi:hypothetical protein